MNRYIGAVEYLVTGIPDAAVHLPEFDSWTAYMRHRLQVEHPNNPNLGSEDGFTDEFFAYALEESRFVFDR